MSDRYYEFGAFRIDPVRRLLFRGGEVVALTAKAFDTLLTLVENRHCVMAKDALMNLIWGEQFVEEGNLTFNISIIRKALGENPKQHEYIVTFPGRGYQFVAEVEEIDISGAAPVERIETKDVVEITETDPNTIAVLPFKSLGAKGEDNYLGLGLADALITRLSNIRQIIVRPTSAVRRFAEDAEQDVVAIGKKLRVASVLEGNFRKAADKIRVTVQLVNVKNERPLWAGKFDETITDIFALEDKITEQIASALTLTLTNEEQERLSKRYTENSEAYQLYIEGRYHAGKWTNEGTMKAIACFEQAIALDSNFPLPYCAWAETYGALWFHGYLPPTIIVPKCKDAIRKVLMIDDNLAEAHSLLAGFLCWYDWNYAEAEKEFKQAIQLSPNLASAHDFYALFLKATGRHDEAIDENRRAIKLDPLSMFTNASMAFAYYYAGDYERALDQCKRANEIEPNFGVTQWAFGLIYEQMGHYVEAVAALEKAVSLTEYSRSILASLGHAYAVAGYEDKARQIIGQLEQISKQSYVPPFEIGLIHAGLENKDEAFALFEKAYEERSAWLTYIRVDPRLKNLHDDSRFKNLIKRVGLAV